jgi:hypothetical protein
MHKIKLKLKQVNTNDLLENLKLINLHFGFLSQENDNVKITFYSQYQIERLLNITKLEKYNIETFIENFGENHKICFYFYFNKIHIDAVNEKLLNHIK